MKPKLLLLLPLAFLIAADAPPDEAQVRKLLKVLNDAYLVRDADAMKRLMADDHVAITSAGQRQKRDEHLKSLPDLKLEEYAMNNIQVTWPTKDTAIVTYECTLKGTIKGKPLASPVLATSAWAKRNGKWLEVLYQETPVLKK